MHVTSLSFIIVIEGVNVNEQVQVRIDSPHSDPKHDGWVWTGVHACICICYLNLFTQ